MDIRLGHLASICQEELFEATINFFLVIAYSRFSGSNSPGGRDCGKNSPLKGVFLLADVHFSNHKRGERNEHRSMKATLLKDPVSVGNRLDALGITRDALLEVIESMVAARNGCTENDPPGAPGWKAWCDGTRRLREVGAPLGWERSDEDHLSSIYDRTRGIKIAVCNTDDGTGVETSQPQNRNKKGAATGRAVNQGVFESIWQETANNVVSLSQTSEGVVYWYLCVFCEGDVIRAELSCPSVCEAGYFAAFNERIFLIVDDGSTGGVRIVDTNPDDDAGFEINVTRKEA